jgi:hypothetical protein
MCAFFPRPLTLLRFAQPAIRFASIRRSRVSQAGLNKFSKTNASYPVHNNTAHTHQIRSSRLDRLPPKNTLHQNRNECSLPPPSRVLTHQAVVISKTGLWAKSKQDAEFLPNLTGSLKNFEWVGWYAFSPGAVCWLSRGGFIQCCCCRY